MGEAQADAPRGINQARLAFAKWRETTAFRKRNAAIDATNEMRELQTKFDAAADLIHEKDRAIRSLNEILANLTAELDTVNERHHADESGITHASSRVAELEDQVDQNNMTIAELNEVLKNLTAELDTVNERHHADESGITHASSRVAELEDQVDQKNMTIAELNEVLKNLSAELDAVNERHRADESGITFASSRVAELEDQVDRNLEMYSALETHTNDVKRRNTVLEQRNEDMEMLVTKMEYEFENEQQRSVEGQHYAIQRNANQTITHLSKKITKLLGNVNESYLSVASDKDSAGCAGTSTTAFETQVNTLLVRCQIAEDQVVQLASMQKPSQSDGSTQTDMEPEMAAETSAINE